MTSRYPRLSLADRSNLRIERPETPQHVAGLCLIEAGPLRGTDGEVDLEAVRRRLDRRLVRVPELRRVVYRPPPFCGPALWVDDPAFSIDRHVDAERVTPPGDEASLLRLTAALLRPPLDRSRPLWRLWVIDGLEGDRLGVLFELHHAVADGLAAIALLASMLDAEPCAPDPPTETWRPAPPPGPWALLADNLRGRAAGMAATLGHPRRLVRGLAAAVADTRDALGGFTAAPHTSLNAIVGPGRRIRVARLDLERARAAAHAHGARVNDVVLTVVTGGVHELLAARGELCPGMELRATMPVALRRPEAARELGNAVGVIAPWLPVDEPDAGRRLEATAAATASAKAVQHPAYVDRLMACLAAVGLAVPFARRQRMVNLFVTNVPGPRDALYFLGARIEDVIPVTGPVGNVTLGFSALSYCGRLDVVVTADARSCPDVDVLVSGMARAWAELTSGRAAGRPFGPVHAGGP